MIVRDKFCFIFMLQSKLFSKTSKNISKDEVSSNSQLLLKAGFIDKLAAGIYSLLPLGWRVIKKIENIIRDEINSVGGQEIFLPTLHPKKNWEETGRWESMKEDLYKVETGKKDNFVLGPTHEEVLVPLAKKIINSYKDLPLYVFQFQNKFRYEKRVKSGVLRTREFLMKDLYSFHTGQEDLDNYYEIVKEAYGRIFQKCGIGEKTYLTYASGGTFSPYSHEFQTLTPAGEDSIYICDKCRTAVNKEILADQDNKCSQCGNNKLREEKAVEVGNIFKLGTKFSKPFNLFYSQENGTKQLAVMGCYGIGLQRLMGAIVEINNDEKGIIWPATVAPFQVHLLELDSRDPQVRKSAQEIYKILQDKRVEVLWDDREEKFAGEKFADCDFIGIPYRLVISKKTLQSGKYEIKDRKAKESKMVDVNELLEILLKK
jgi:prolyl-tRNA synthetase